MRRTGDSCHTHSLHATSRLRVPRLIPTCMRLTCKAPGLLTVVVAICTAGSPAYAQAVGHATVQAPAHARELAPGVTYRQRDDPRGPWRLHILHVDLRRTELKLQAMRALDSLRGRERTSQMVQRATAAGARVLAAVNADFFDVLTGENENNQVIDGEWWKGLKVTDSPYDSYDNVHAQLALDMRGRPTIDRFILDGTAWSRSGMLPILSVNAKLSTAMEGTTLYTPRFGATTPHDPSGDSTRVAIEAPLTAAGARGDTLLFVRHGALVFTTGSAIPPDGAVLAAHGARAAAVKALAEGDTVRVLLSTLPRLLGYGPPRVLVGGWPRLLQDGVIVARDAATLEGTISRNAEARHPRTAIGYAKNSRTLWLVTVDGRSAASVGMTLVELAEVMRTLGAWEALNFDGGGSTTMVIDGTVVNTPTDASGERPVGNALLLVQTPTLR